MGWNFDSDFEEFGLVRFGGVGRDECEVILVAGFVDVEVGEPLEGGGGPFEGMDDGEIIVIGGSFFPDFVLVVNHHFLFFVVFWVRSWLPSAIFAESTLNWINYKQTQIICISILFQTQYI